MLFDVDEVLFIDKFHILCSIFFIEIYVGVLININRFTHMDCVGQFVFVGFQNAIIFWVSEIFEI